MKFFYLILLFILIVSCNSRERRLEAEQEKKAQKLEENREKAINILLSKYTVNANLDTLKFKYSFAYQELFNDRVQIISNPKLIDLYKVDSIYFARVKARDYPSIILDLAITNPIAETLIKDFALKDVGFQSDIFWNKYILAVKIERIRKVFFELNGYIDDISLDIDFEDSDNYIGRGELVDIIKIQ